MSQAFAGAREAPAETSETRLADAIHFGFLPDPARARALDRRMQRELADSLRHVFQASEGVLAFDTAAAARLCAALEKGPAFGPAVFRRYYDLVAAIQGEDHAAADALIAGLCGARPAPDGLAVAVLGDPVLGAESDRFAAMMDSDPDVRFGIQRPPADQADAFRHRLHEGLRLVDAALPELAGEIRAIVRQVVIVGGDPALPMQFDGGSHYQLWGALFLNAAFHPDAAAIVEVLAHESAHSLLFGFCTDVPLVTNDAGARYASPLRADKRPMDGIYHATYVSARMHWAMTRLAESGCVDEPTAARARAAAEADRANFAAGLDVVQAHGALTPVGQALMDAAAAHMRAAA